MSRFTMLLLVIVLNAGLSYGMQCSIGHKNIVSKMIDSCPGLLQSSEKSYCCLDIENGEMYCCNAMEFALKSSWIFLTAIACLLIGLCVSCFCCRCCPRCRRRHQGTVYGRVQVPTVVHVIQSPASVQQPAPHYTHPVYPTSSIEDAQPPRYADVVYEKQAPYNPNYAPLVHQ